MIPVLLAAALAAAPIPRAALFGAPAAAAVQVSPDGMRLAWLAPVQGVANVFVAPRAAPARAVAVTYEAVRDLRELRWSRDSRRLLFARDAAGDENFKLWSVPADGGPELALTPAARRAERLSDSAASPGKVLAAVNTTNPYFADFVAIDVATGASRTVLANPGGVYAAAFDAQLRPVLAVRPERDGGASLLRAAGDGWTPARHLTPDDIFGSRLLGAAADGRSGFVLDSSGRDTAALREVGVDGSDRVLAADPRFDVSEALLSPRDGRPDAVAVTAERRRWRALDPRLAPFLADLQGRGRGDVEVLSRSDDDRWWTVAFEGDITGLVYALYDTQRYRLTPLLAARPALAGRRLAAMTPLWLKARDGRPLLAYVTRPPDATGPGPAVLLVHGGPWDRDTWGFNPVDQWLADRGYTVVRVEFRSSTGFGKTFTAAGDGQWGAAINDDQTDALDAVVAKGWVDRRRVAIMGASFGGYSALVGLTRTPETFACGVDIVGPARLQTLMQNPPDAFVAAMERFYRGVGDPRTAEGRALLDARSPLTHAGAIRRPLLIAQGANDPRVKRDESDAMAAAAAKNGAPVTYLLFPDEGHGVVREPNRIALYAAVESFLGRCLGGRAVPPTAEDLQASSMQVPIGAEDVPGLKAALAAGR